MDEIWKEIPEFNGIYAVSNFGNVRNLKYQKTKKQSIHKAIGYKYVCLCKSGVCKTFYIHRLVAEIFLGHETNLEVNHKDGNKENNHISNLEWVTHHENILHSHRIGLNKINQVKGSRTGTAKLNEQQVSEILELKGKMTQSSIAKKYNVSTATVWGILNNRSWKHTKRS